MANGPGVGDGMPIGFAASTELRPQSNVQEINSSVRNPDMKGRATPLKDNPVTEQQKKDLRNAFRNMGDQDLAEKLLAEAGINEPVTPEFKKDLSQEAKKPQGFLAQIIEWFKTTFRNLFR